MHNSTTHRALVGGAGVAAIVAATLAAASALRAPANLSADPIWSKLVADFGVKYTAWLAALDVEEDADDMFRDACAALPAEPAKPGSAISEDVLNKAGREIRDACHSPEQKKAWADYMRKHAAWTAQRDTLREQILAQAKNAYDCEYTGAVWEA